MRDRDAPPGVREGAPESPRVMTVGAAFQAVEQHQRPAAAGEVDVDEIAVGRLPALADERRPRARPQGGSQGLQMTDQCSVLGGGSRAAACFSAGAGEAWCTIMRQPVAVRR